MLGKCVWKVHLHGDNPLDPRYTVDAVLATIRRAIKFLPARKDPSRQEPILEPIYKMVVFAHKMVHRGEIDVCNTERVAFPRN